MATCDTQLGVREDPRTPNAGVQVNKYLKTVGLPGGYYWCAAYPKWVFLQNGVLTPGANGAARTFFPRSKLIYERTTGRYQADPLPADLGSVYYSNLGRIGHVFYVRKWVKERGMAATHEGNTNDGGSRNGDGVYNKIRVIRQVYSVSRWVPVQLGDLPPALPGRGNRLDTSLHRT